MTVLQTVTQTCECEHWPWRSPPSLPPVNKTSASNNTPEHDISEIEERWLSLHSWPAQLPARTMSGQCCCFSLSTKSVLGGACTYKCVDESACERGLVLDLKKHSPVLTQKALCLQRGNDTSAEQKKLNTILASVARWSYDTGPKEHMKSTRAPLISGSGKDNSWKFVPV